MSYACPYCKGKGTTDRPPKRFVVIIAERKGEFEQLVWEYRVDSERTLVDVLQKVLREIEK